MVRATVPLPAPDGPSMAMTRGRDDTKHILDQVRTGTTGTSGDKKETGAHHPSFLEDHGHGAATFRAPDRTRRTSPYPTVPAMILPVRRVLVVGAIACLVAAWLSYPYLVAAAFVLDLTGSTSRVRRVLPAR